MKEIELTQGFVSLVDDDMFDYLNNFKWCYAHGYAATNFHKFVGRSKNVFMHRLIINTPDGFQTDHIDGNKLNNQRSNLRVCTNSQNQANKGKRNSTSLYKGVHKHRNKWQAEIRVNSKSIYLGHFDDPIEAAKAYDEAAKKYHGVFAKTNF